MHTGQSSFHVDTGIRMLCELAPHGRLQGKAAT